MHLSTEQEKLLRQALRNNWAKRLRLEREHFRHGPIAVMSLKAHQNLNFITRKTETPYSDSGDLNLAEINEAYEDAKKSLGKHDCSLTIEFGADQTESRTGCSGCYCSGCGTYEATVEITFQRFKFNALEYCKSYIRNRIGDSVRDARFKFEHQAGGKDVRRYLEMIERVQS